MLDIKIRILSDNVHIPEKIEIGDWIDLQTSKDVVLGIGESMYIPLGVCIELPKGYEAILAPRSSTFKKYGLLQSNSIGIFDESFCGDEDEWKMPVYATRPVSIPAGTRLCQFRLFKHTEEVRFIQVDHMTKKSRGGWGSTGD